MIRNDEPLDTTGYYDPDSLEYVESARLTFFREGGTLTLDEFEAIQQSTPIPDDDGDIEDEEVLDIDDEDVEDYWSNGWDDGPDPDDARDRMIEDGRWNGVD